MGVARLDTLFSSNFAWDRVFNRKKRESWIWFYPLEFIAGVFNCSMLMTTKYDYPFVRDLHITCGWRGGAGLKKIRRFGNVSRTGKSFQRWRKWLLFNKRLWRQLFHDLTKKVYIWLIWFHIEWWWTIRYTKMDRGEAIQTCLGGLRHTADLAFMITIVK